MSKVLASPLRGSVLEQCHTKVLLPNPQAIADGASSYELMGLGRRDRELIANAVPKSDYYVTSPDGKRMVSLELQRLTLSFIASSSDRDRARVDELIAQNPVGWQADWLEERGLSDWAKVYLDLAGANEVYV
jgi:type IV secretion system protein TrbE